MSYAVIEGADGTGKTTLARNLAEVFGAVFRYEPDSTTEITKKLREFCLDKKYDPLLTPNAREYLMMANRSISTIEVAKALAEGIRVVQDRSFLSGMVYAKVASKMSFSDWWDLGKRAIAIKPDIIVYITSNKQSIDKVENDIYDNADNEFHQRIIDTFEDAIEFVKALGIKVIRYNNDFNNNPKDNAIRLSRIIKENFKHGY